MIIDTLQNAHKYYSVHPLFQSAFEYIAAQNLTAIETGKFDKEDNPLKNAPHTYIELASNEWNHKYTREEAAFPNEDPSLILRYSKEDYQWALDNEYKFWQYLVDENLLFKIDERTVANMINEGPFTPGLPDQNSPDRLGQFLGWRMIHSYMEQYDISVSELINLTFNEILQAYEID